MQIGVNVKCMQTNFGGCGFAGFGDIATFLCLQKWPNFPLWIMEGKNLG